MARSAHTPPPSGPRVHRVTWQNPAPPVPNGEGGYTEVWADCVPAATFCTIEPASTQSLERLGVGTITTVASHLITTAYHPQVTTATRAVFNGRRFSVTSPVNVDERNVTTVAICVEVLP